MMKLHLKLQKAVVNQLLLLRIQRKTLRQSMLLKILVYLMTNDLAKQRSTIYSGFIKIREDAGPVTNQDEGSNIGDIKRLNR